MPGEWTGVAAAGRANVSQYVGLPGLYRGLGSGSLELEPVGCRTTVVGQTLRRTSGAGIVNIAAWRDMNRYRWARRIFLSGLVIFGLWFGFAFVVRVLGIVIAGVEPEAWVLTAMMTAPLAIAGVAVLTGGTAAAERVFRKG